MHPDRGGRRHFGGGETAPMSLARALPEEPRRPTFEAFIQQRFRKAHGAYIRHFMSELFGLSDEISTLCAVVGVRLAGTGELFPERYLDEPIDSLISAAAGCPVNRASIVDALEGKVSLDSYRAFLTLAYYHVRHTVPLMMACGARLPTIDLTQTIRDCLVQLTPWLLSKRLELAFDDIERPCKVATDAAAIDIALNNLITNAANFAPEHGVISVQLSQSEGFYHLTVEDQGPGIDEADRARLFERLKMGEKPNIYWIFLSLAANGALQRRTGNSESPKKSPRQFGLSPMFCRPSKSLINVALNRQRVERCRAP